MGIVTLKQYVEMREGLLLPDRPPAKGLSRINPFPTTAAHRRRIKPKPPNVGQPFPPTVRAVHQVVPQNLIPKPGHWPGQGD
jgi:hypothetical protein